MNDFETLIKDFHELSTEDPNTCVELGVNRNLDRLPDPSLTALRAETEAWRRLLEQAEALSTEGLSFDEQLDLEIATLMIRARVFQSTYTFNGKTQAEQQPAGADGITDGMFMMFINDPRSPHARLDDLLGRMEGIPAFLEAMLARLDTPVKRWVSMDIEKIEGAPDLLENIATWAESEKYPQLERLKTARLAAEKAMKDYTAALAALPTTEAFAIGEDQARTLVQLRGIELPLEQLHQIARDFQSRVAGEIETLRGTIAARYDLGEDASVETVHAFLNERYQVALGPKGLAGIIDRYQEERRKILSWIQERELFPVFDEQDMVILQTPVYFEPSIPAGAMVSPPPFREGVKTSLVYLTLREDLLDEHNELEIAGMMLHEGIPGHHLQLATAATHPSVIRRHIFAPEHAEGWTTMLEDYMLDMGYMGDLTDEARFIFKRGIARLGARVAIDLYFMTGDASYLDIGVEIDADDADPFVNAGRLLAATTGFTPGRIEAELNWYSQERGYPLSYLTGNHLVWSLKRDLTASQAGSVEGVDLDRAFHDVYLNSGNMPLRFLRRVLEHKGLLPVAA